MAPFLIQDSVEFLVPRSRELLFPVLAMVEGYVERFPSKMQQQDTQPHIPGKRYQLHFSLDWAAEEREFFTRAGLRFAQPPEEIPYPDSIVDLREERLEAFKHQGRRHIADVCGIMSGSLGLVIPRLRMAQSAPGAPWGRIGDFPTPFPAVALEGAQLLNARDGEWGGVVAYQSWETYLAASMGLPVIEILPRGQPRQWLSKWINTRYRLVEEGRSQPLRVQLRQAFDNLEEIACSQVPVVASALPAPMAPIPSGVGSVTRLSPSPTIR